MKIVLIIGVFFGIGEIFVKELVVRKINLVLVVCLEDKLYKLVN